MAIPAKIRLKQPTTLSSSSSTTPSSSPSASSSASVPSPPPPLIPSSTPTFSTAISGPTLTFPASQQPKNLARAIPSEASVSREREKEAKLEAKLECERERGREIKAELDDEEKERDEIPSQAKEPSNAPLFSSGPLSHHHHPQHPSFPPPSPSPTAGSSPLYLPFALPGFSSPLKPQEQFDFQYFQKMECPLPPHIYFTSEGCIQRPIFQGPRPVLIKPMAEAPSPYQTVEERSILREALKKNRPRGALDLAGRREIHNVSERKRRNTIKSGFQELREKIPFPENEKQSKIEILRKAIKHIQILQQRRSSLMIDIDKIKVQVHQLRGRLTQSEV